MGAIIGPHAKVIGAAPDIFMPDRHGEIVAPGGAGQFVLADYPLTFVGDRRCNDRWGLPVDELLDYLVFDWSDGDGPAPLVGPSLAAAGSPVQGVASPWTRHDDVDVTMTAFAANQNYTSATLLNPSSGQDAVILYIGRRFHAATGILVATRTVAAGWQIYETNANIKFRSDDGTNSATSVAPMSPGGLIIVGVTFEAGANQKLYINGKPEATTDVSALGALAGVGFGLNSRPDAQQDLAADASRTMIWYGNGIAAIADDDWWARVAASMMGIHPRTGAVGATYSRTGARVYDLGSRIHVLAPGIAPAGNAVGRANEDAATTKTYKNCQIVVGDDAILTATGGMTLSVDSQAAALEEDGCRELGLNAFKVVNATGSDQYVYYGATVGNLNTHWPSVRGRANTSWAEVGLYRPAVPTWTGAAYLVSGYQNRATDGITPVHADQVWGLKIPDNSTVRFILSCLTESAIRPPEVSNLALAATASVGEGVITLPSTLQLDDRGGRIECDLTPDGWSGNTRGIRERIIGTTGMDIALVSTNVALPKIVADDGPNVVNYDITESDGVEWHAFWGWGDRGLIAGAGLDGAINTSYDGTVNQSGAITTNGIGRKMKNLRILRNQGGRP